MYGWGAVNVGKYRRTNDALVSDAPDDSELSGAFVGSTTGGLAIRRRTLYGVPPRIDLPEDATPRLDQLGVSAPKADPVISKIVIDSSVIPAASVPPVQDAGGIFSAVPWWGWLAGAGGLYFAFGRGKR